LSVSSLLKKLRDKKLKETKGQVVRRKRHCGRQAGSDKLLVLERFTGKGERKAVRLWLSKTERVNQ
jgi:hypothetical protein